MRRKSLTELLKQAQGLATGPAVPLPGQSGIALAGVADVPRDKGLDLAYAKYAPVPVQAAPVDPDDAIVARMVKAAVSSVQHRQRRERIIAKAVEATRVALGLASDQRELDAEITELVTKDLG